MLVVANFANTKRYKQPAEAYLRERKGLTSLKNLKRRNTISPSYKIYTGTQNDTQNLKND